MMGALMPLPLLLAVVGVALAQQPANLHFDDCFSGNDSQKLDVSNVYAQVLHGTNLNLTIFGTSPIPLIGSDNSSHSLATLFTSTDVLTLDVASESSYLCSALRPPSPLPTPSTDVNMPPNNQSYCPLAVGPFGLSTVIPLGSNHPLMTLTTRIRAVDPFSQELLCLDVSTTPLNAGKYHSWYGEAAIIFWASVALAAAYWVVVGTARLSSAWRRGIMRQRGGVWEMVESTGFILASAISGERFAHSPALMRFCTPSMRDIIFHLQWCSALAMVAVQWPTFVYPLLRQTAWSVLAYNITLVPHGDHRRWDPLSVDPFNPPSGFTDQITDSNSPLFIDPNVRNTLFLLPANATSGMSSFAYTIGLRPEDLWSTCMIVFLGIIAGAIALSLLIWLIDWLASLIGKNMWGRVQRPPAKYSTAGRELLESPTPAAGAAVTEENKSLSGHNVFRTTSRFTLPLTSGNGKPPRKGWWRVHTELSSFHGSVLHGNIVRILVLFHLPVTIFSCYEMTYPRSEVQLFRIILAALSFVVISIIIPVALILRVRFTSTNKLYDEMRTLLTFGPLYNHYRHGSQMFACLFFATNLMLGITIGCGQRSGTAQAIIILIVEVTSALVTSIWLPWGQGASMGLISFLFCVARIVIAVLLVILAPAISIGTGPSAWVAYGILIVLALVFVALFLMLFVKILEGFVRIGARTGFERSNHVVDSGLLGVLGLIGCCGRRRSSRRGRRRSRSRGAYTPTATTLSANDGPYYAPPKVASISSRKGSTTSVPPPSVLKPEHALRPYREDTDDENGFIMGAWRAPSNRGYSPVSDGPSKPSSGFSRVGGGRAHYESPYAIAPGSLGNNSKLSQHRMQPTTFDDDDDDSVATSVVNDARRPEISNLPPGAMNPLRAHRTSQTAIIEDSSAFIPALSGGSAGLAPPSPFANDDDNTTQSSTPPKKAWYNLKRHRKSNSNGENAVAAPSSSLPASDPPPTTGRSFVVVRKPQQSRLGQTPSPAGDNSMS